MRALLALGLLACGGGDTEPPGGLPVAEPCEIAPPDGGAVSADGTALVDSLGRLVYLRGMNTGGRSKFPPFLPFAFDDATFDADVATYWDRMQAWGFDAARLVFTWEAVEPTQGAIDEAFLSRYDALVDAAWARGIRVIVDFHQDVYARMYCGDGFPEWTIPPELHQDVPADCSGWFGGYLTNDNVRAAFDRFWTNADGIQDAYFAMFDAMVARYADRPGVLGFEPINEPGWGTASVAAWEVDVLTPFFATFADRVHATAPATLVFLDAPGLDGLTVTTAIEDPGVPGIVFAPHYYDPNTVIAGEYVPDGAVDAAVATWADVGADWDVPVFLGEFGADRSIVGVGAYMHDVMAALDVHQMSGTAWEYSTSDELWSQENFSLVEADGTEREHVEGLVRPYVRAAAGREVVQSWDLETRTFDATMVPAAGGVTEIALPDRTYPEGFRVGVSSGCADVDLERRVVRVRAGEGAEGLEIEIRPE